MLVVTSEVRNSAERSQQAAKDINRLPHSQIALAKDAGRKLSLLVPDIQKTAARVAAQ